MSASSKNPNTYKQDGAVSPTVGITVSFRSVHSSLMHSSRSSTSEMMVHAEGRHFEHVVWKTVKHGVYEPGFRLWASTHNLYRYLLHINVKNKTTFQQRTAWQDRIYDSQLVKNPQDNPNFLNPTHFSR